MAGKFKGEVRELEGISECPLCHKTPKLRKDSTKRFQIACECGAKTGWGTKPQVIIAWYKLREAAAKKEAEGERWH